MSEPSLLPPSATASERAIEAAVVERVPAPIRELWDPDTCPAALLPWLAWALSIDAWKDYWPEHIKRARIRNAIAIQRKKGTVQSVRDVAASFGGQIALREWFQNTPPTVPHTFDVVLTVSGEGGQTATAQFIDDVAAEIDRTKPLRSHMTITQGVEAIGAVGIAVGVRVAIYRRMQFEEV